MSTQPRKNDKIRIAFLASTMPMGGAEKVTLNLFSNIDRSQFECEAYFLKDAGTLGREMIPFVKRLVERLQHGRTDPSVILKLFKYFRSFSPHVVLTISCHRNAMYCGNFVSLIAGVPARVIAVHATGTMEDPRNFPGMDRILLPPTTAVVALSDTHRRYLKNVDRIDDERIVVIENGIDTESYEHVDPELLAAARSELSITETDKLVIMIAALRPEKAHEAFLSAANAVLTTREHVKFLIVGDGPRRAELHSIARSLPTAQNILFLGERHDIPVLLNMSDVLVLPSHSAVETLPLVIMEAMAAGIPVIASAVGSVPDMIQDRTNGRLIGPADSAALASAIAELLDNGNLSRTLVENGRATVREKYTLARMVRDYEVLFQRLARAV